MSEDKSSPPERGTTWVKRALGVADAADDWFLSMARTVGKAAGRAAQRARDEATIVADSAQKAADTTRNVSRDIIGGIKRSTHPPPKMVKRHKALSQALSGVVAQYKDGLDAIDTDAFERLVDDLKEQVAFELRLLQESRPKNGDGDKAQEPEVRDSVAAKTRGSEDEAGRGIVSARVGQMTVGESKAPSRTEEPPEKGDVDKKVDG